MRRLRSAFSPNTFGTEIIELTIAVLAAHGPLDELKLAERVHRLLGHGWQRDGQPLTLHDVRMAIAKQSSIMRGLDLLDDADWHACTAGPSARSLLPRAEMLAEFLTYDE
ncbi:Plasmid pRiA4b ORF-3-like protein [Mycobacterium tuberculosis]|nr:Plasmid pRiA4b ORF-3-like protein [Mycobacterium tuberculosis]